MRLYLPGVLAVGSLLCAQAPLPPASELKDPAGQAVLYKFQTLQNSVQIYTCKPAGGRYAWSGPDPDAIMTTGDEKLIVHHYKGPTWEATDGSIVRASGAKHYQATQGGSVDWLELTATGGTGKFARVSNIHRIETSGGVPPASACDAGHNSQQARIPYHATYIFYAPKKN